MTMGVAIAMSLVLAQAAMPAMKDMPPSTAACPATPAPLSAALAGWRRTTAARAGATVAGAPVLPIGSRVAVTLLPTTAVKYAVPPGPHDAATATGGLFAFTVPAAGRYRVALDAGPWIDVIENGAALPSTGHGHGPDCSGIRKIVDFDLKPGRHYLQVSENKTATLAVMIVRAP